MRIYRCLSVFLFLFVSIVLLGGFSLVSEGNDLKDQMKTLQKEPLLDSILEKMDKAYEKIQSLEINFSQTKTMMLMAQPVSSEGILIFDRSGQLYWKFNNPDQMIMVVNGTQLIIHYPDLNQADIMEIEKYKDRVAKYLGFSDSMTKLKRYYDMRVVEEGQTTYFLELLPKRRRIKQKLDVLEIWLNKVTFLPEKIHYREPNGDSTVVNVLSVKENQDYDHSIFDYSLPEGTTINYPMKNKSDKEKD